MEVFEQFRLILILIMAFFSYHHINSLPALPYSDDEEQQVVEAENQDGNVNENEVLEPELSVDEQQSQASPQAIYPSQDILVKQEISHASNRQFFAEEVIDIVSSTPEENLDFEEEVSEQHSTPQNVDQEEEQQSLSSTIKKKKSIRKLKKSGSRVKPSQEVQTILDQDQNEIIEIS